MRRLKLVGVIGALCTLGVIAASASAFTLPDISIALGGTYPIHSEGSLPKALTDFGSSAGVVAHGEGFSLLTLTKELSSLGEYSETILKYGRAGEKCNSIGDATGVILMSGAFHIVLGPGGTKSLLFILFLPATFIIKCEGGLEIELRGSVLGTYNLLSGTETDEYESAGVVLEGTKGKQKFTEYFNDGGTIVKAKFETESGSGFVESNTNVEGELRLTTLEKKMYTVTGR